MKKGKFGYVFSVLLLLLLSKSVIACTTTLNPGTNVITTAISSSSSNDIICLNPGSYTESSTILLKDGQTLKGLGTNNTDTVIYSSAATSIKFEYLADYITLYHFHLDGTAGSSSFYGIHSESNHNLLIWDLVIEHIRVPIAVFGGDYTSIWNVYTANNGLSNVHPEPDIFVYESDHVDVVYGNYVGAQDGPGGDGGIVCWKSNDFLIDHAHISFSGSSSVYYVDCDNSTVQYSNIYESDEWGLDIVGGVTAGLSGDPWYMTTGNANFTAIGNTITNSYYGASVFDEPANGTGTYTNNDFINNDQGSSRNCQGITVIGGSTGNVTLSGNYANPSGEICSD